MKETKKEAMKPLGDIPKAEDFRLDRAILGAEVFLEMVLMLRQRQPEMEIAEITRLQPGILKVRAQFGEVLHMPGVAATFWVFDMGESRHCVARFSIGRKKIDFSELLGVDLLDALHLPVPELKFDFELPAPEELWWSARPVDLPQAAAVDPALADDLRAAGRTRDLQAGLNLDVNATLGLGDLLGAVAFDIPDMPRFDLILRPLLDGWRLQFSLGFEGNGEGDRLQLQFQRLALQLLVRGKQVRFEGISLSGEVRRLFGVDLKFSARLDLAGKRLALRFRDFPTMADVFTSLDKAHLLPTDNPLVDAAANFKVFELAILADLGKMEVERLQMAVGYEEDITIFKDMLAIRPALQIDARHPLNADRRVVRWQVGGVTTVADARFQSQYTHDNRMLTLRMMPGTVLSSKTLLERLGVDTHDFDLQLVDMDVVARLKSPKSLHMEIDVADASVDVEGEGFAFRELWMQLDYHEKDGLQDLVLQGWFHLGQLQIEAVAQYHKEGGWSLIGRTRRLRGQLGEVASLTGISDRTDAQDDILQTIETDFGLTLDINQLMLRVDKVRGKKTTFGLLIDLKNIRSDKIPIKVDALLLSLNWGKVMTYDAVLVLTLAEAREDENGDELPATVLRLESHRKAVEKAAEGDDAKPVTGTEISFLGSIEHFRMDDLLSFLHDKFDIRTDDLPAPLRNFRLDLLEVGFSKGQKEWEFAFACKGSIPFTEKTGKQAPGLDAAIRIAVRKTEDGYAPVIDGSFKVRPEMSGALAAGQDQIVLEFKLHYAYQKGNHLLVAAYAGQHTQVDLGAVLRTILGDGFPEFELEIELKDALLAVGGARGQKPKFLFGLDLKADLSLEELPLLGKADGSWLEFGLENLRLLYASKAWTEKEIKALNKQLPAGIEPIPLTKAEEGGAGAEGDAEKGKEEIEASNGADEADVFRKGFAVSAQLNVGGQLIPIMPGSGAEASAEPTSPGGGETTGASGEGLPSEQGSGQESGEPSAAAAFEIKKWFNIDKDIGPLHLDRIGVRFRDGALWFMLDAALGIAILNVSVEGLAFGSPLDEFAPRFEIDGLGLEVQKGPLHIGGGFLRVPTADAEVFEFSGGALIRFKKIGISALGSWLTLPDGTTSFMLYALLDVPLGGPPFFFVTGLAAGFGIHRRLLIPEIDQLGTFPLISDALDVGAAKSALQKAGGRNFIKDKVAGLRRFMPASKGDYFFAVGVRFTSFKLLDSFVLLTVQLGNHFEVNLLGTSQLIAPPPETGKAIDPLAKATLLVRAAFRPEDGILSVEGRLDPKNSYILSKDCHLQGGFALYTWFDGTSGKKNPHAGDFVLTVGGYHPRYAVPKHYPTVPRLGFNWKVDRRLSLKGGIYFALTTNALMAGGSLEADYRDDHLHAWFRFRADFLIAWNPFHYEAGIHLSMGVAYELGLIHLKLELAVELEVWGPEFGGRAMLDLGILTIEVGFGAARKPKVTALKPLAFANAFLPLPEDVAEGKSTSDFAVLNLSAMGGQTASAPPNPGELGAMDPAGLEIRMESVVPITGLDFSGQMHGAPVRAVSGLGIAPMNKTSLDAPLTVTIRKDSANAAQFFVLEPLTEAVPKALWGDRRDPNLREKSGLIAGVCMGFSLRPLPAVQEAPLEVAEAALALKRNLHPGNAQVRRPRGAGPKTTDFSRATAAGYAETSLQADPAFLAALGLAPGADVSGDLPLIFDLS